MITITTITIISLLIVSLVTLAISVSDKKVFFLLSIPVVFAFLFALTVANASYYGYAIDLKRAHIEEALVIYATESNDYYYLLIREMGSVRPRFVSMGKNNDNKREFDEITKEAKDGVYTVIRSRSFIKRNNEGNDNPVTSDIEILSATEQTIFKKD
jgi:hypothetical protein